MTQPILINGRFLTQKPSGVQRFAYEITSALIRQGACVRVIAPHNSLPDYTNTPFTVEYTCSNGSHIWEQIILPAYIRRHYPGSLLLNFTGLSPLCYPHNVMTIHDVSFLVNPTWFSRRYYWFYRIFTPIASRYSKHIITVSEFSRHEIIQYLGIKNQKISVVYNAPDSFSAVEQKDNNHRPYLLAVSSIDPRKNLKRLIDAYGILHDPTFDLIIIGSRNHVFAKDGNLSDYPGIKFLGYVDKQQLETLYHNATAFISPSLYEGFGLPNIEAMQSGCPITISDIPPYREVCKDGALYFDAQDTQSIANAMQRIMKDSPLREVLRKKGQWIAKQYTWDQSANRLLTILAQEKLI